MNSQTRTPTQLTGRVLTFSRIIWIGLTLLVAGLWGWAISAFPEEYLEDVPFGLLMPLGFMLIAFIIYWYKSSDIMGWLVSLMLVFLGPYLIAGVNELVATVPAWQGMNQLLVSTGMSTFFLFLCLFPNGRFVPTWLKWFAILNVVLIYAASFLNPTIWSSATVAIFMVSVVVGFLGQIYRFTYVSDRSQRQQTKWVILGLSGPVFTVFWWFLIIVPGVLQLPQDTIAHFIHQSIFAALALSLPVSIAVSILRYRLWDIDILINRTLVYGALTAALALIYFGSVVLLQTIFRLVTGEGQSEIVTVFSTLAIAALFTPLRRRIQAVIDHRFYRRKYDAVQTLAAFASAARDEVDLNELTGRLLEAVEDTVQPAHVSVWLRPAEEKEF
jgi:hypothetical protein